MKRGPKPKLFATKLISGTAQADRNRNPNMPQSPIASTEPPPSLTKRELFHWNRLAPLLVDAGILTRLDLTLLRMLVGALAELDAIDAALRKTKFTQKTKRGGATTNPLWRMKKDAQNRALRMMADFYLTPSSRERLHIDLPQLSEQKLAPADVEREAAIDEKFFGKQS